MFTGIVETVGVVREIMEENTNRHFRIESPISSELKVDQSVSHNGVCLTVTNLASGSHWVTAIQETLQKSNLQALTAGSLVNLERCMKADGRFDGHIVQGHVDQTAICKSIQNANGSYVFQFSFEPSKNSLIVEKGSICVNGVSLTCFDISQTEFTVAIIPYTWEHTTFKTLQVGDSVNLEFDIIGKYVQAMMNARQSG